MVWMILYGNNIPIIFGMPSMVILGLLILLEAGQ
jgi:hypothetical protein